MYIVYILQSTKNNRYYIGYTEDVNGRLGKHNSGGNRSTKNGRPWIIIYTENFADKKSAWLREKQIKSYKGGEAFRKLLQSK